MPSHKRRWRKITFTFDWEHFFRGETDDTRWNGWLNVRVTPAVDAKVRASLGPESKDMGAPLGPDGFHHYAYGFTALEAVRCPNCMGRGHAMIHCERCNCDVCEGSGYKDVQSYKP